MIFNSGKSKTHQRTLIAQRPLYQHQDNSWKLYQVSDDMHQIHGSWLAHLARPFFHKMDTNIYHQGAHPSRSHLMDLGLDYINEAHLIHTT